MKTKLLVLLFLASLTTYAQTNLVPNGNFETWTSSSQPDNWFRYFSGFASQSNSAQNGTSSTNMMIADGTFNFINSQFFPVVANKTYRVTLYHKLVSGSFSAIDLSLYHKPGTFKEEIIKKTDATVSSSEWRKIEFDYTPIVSENIEVDIWTTGTLNSEILVDNVSVIDVATIGAPYTLIPDVNFEKYLISSGWDKDGVNGKVLTANIKTVKSIDISYSTEVITDLTGVQDFSALETLMFRGNKGKLTFLDVSKNVNLKILNCGSNQLTTLDVSKNVALTTLNFGDNKLTSIDVTNNLDLTYLGFDSNQLVSLDVSRNVALTSLSCRVNKLTVLDITKNTALTYVDFTGNPLTILDFSKNDKLTNIKCGNCLLTSIDLTNNVLLKSLTINDNKLTSIDLTKNESLIYLDCSNNQIKTLNLNQNKELINLEASDNNLVSLDLSENTKLKSVWCLSNSLKTLNVTKNIFLTDLHVHYNDLTDLDVSKNIALTGLNLNYNSLSTIDISKNVNLTSFSCERNNLTSLDISKNIALTSINCNDNKIESFDISKNTLLNYLKIENNKLLYDLNLKNGNNTKIQTLNLKGNINLTCVLVDNKIYSDSNWATYKETWTNYSEDCRVFTSIPDSNFEAKLISLGIDIDGKNGKVLTSSIAQIKTLDVSNNNIANLMGIQDFAMLETLNCQDNQLLYLDLSKNILLNSLNCSNNKLVSLDLKNGKNTLLNKGISSFTNNINLKCIQVDDENYSNTNWPSLKDVTANYNTLCNSFVSIPDTNFEDKLIALGIDVDGKNGKVLSYSISSITTLDLSASKISDLTGIQGFVGLKELNCSSNNLKGIDLGKNTALTTLNVSSNQLLNLDLSKNILLEKLLCPSNNLFSLNLKNGNNSKMLNMSSGNLKNNPSLTCIQVDDVTFSNTNWSDAKETTASYSTACTTNNFTLIPDANFENKLIALGVDKDGFNGGVLTSSISALKELSLLESQNAKTNPIQDLTGIQDFVSLEKLVVVNNYVSKANLSKNVLLKELNLSGNRLSELDISKNILLSKFQCRNNLLTQIDLSKNALLNDFWCDENKLTSLDLSSNPELFYLYCRDNKLTNLNLTKNTNLNYLNCTSNLLPSLDISNNLYINYLFCGINQLKSLSVTKNLSLSQFICDKNLLTNIDVSKNISLSFFSCSSNQITSLDFSNNSSLYSLYCSANQLTSLNVVKNKKLQTLDCSSNNLNYLNIKNGNYLKFSTQYSSGLNFTKNPNLTCIQVDDVEYSNANWKLQKDETATYSLACGAPIMLPSNNFAIESKGETCNNTNNGEINITSSATYFFEAKINTNSYTFTNNSLKVLNLTPGTYTISITIPGENFEQNFTIVIPKGATITGKSSVVANKVSVEITEGTAPYTVLIDGVEQFETTDSNFTVDAKKGGLLQVKTAKACEGIYAKDIARIDGAISAYPNPTSGSFEIEMPTSKNKVEIGIYTLNGNLISTKSYTIENGKAQLSLENQPSGVYVVKIELDTPDYLKIIKN